MVKNRKYYIYQLWELIRANIGDDDSLDARLIGAWLDNARSLVISNELNKHRFNVDESLVQEAKVNDVGVVPLENSTIGVHGLNIFSPTKRTIIDIPYPLPVNNSWGFTRIGSTDKSQPGYRIVSLEELPYVGNGRFNAKEIVVFIWENKIYLYTKSPNNVDFKLLKKISIRGLWESPADVPGYVEGDPYPISSKIFNYIQQLVIDNNYKLVMAAKSDEVNNSKED